MGSPPNRNASETLNSVNNLPACLRKSKSWQGMHSGFSVKTLPILHCATMSLPTTSEADTGRIADLSVSP